MRPGPNLVFIVNNSQASFTIFRQFKHPSEYVGHFLMLFTNYGFYAHVFLYSTLSMVVSISYRWYPYLMILLLVSFKSFKQKLL